MKERPILFSAPMVRALRDGSKTQTRRIAKGSENWPATTVRVAMLETRGTAMAIDSNRCSYGPELKSTYGSPGDRLWVRETWCGEIDATTSQLIYDEDGNTYKCLYRADGHHVVLDDGDGFTKTNRDGSEASPWKPSIHMPRWASRITLDVTGVRVERLQDISDADAIAEGISLNPSAIGVKCGNSTLARAMYRDLWESINGAGAWDLNPWVWVIEFKRVQP